MAKMNSTENFDLKKSIICHISECPFFEKNVPVGGRRFWNLVVCKNNHHLVANSQEKEVDLS